MTTADDRLRRIEDSLEIADLRARYCHLLDDRRWPEFVDLFTEDGVFVGLESVHGREEIRTFFTDRVPKLAEAFWHFCTDGTVEIDGDEAHGRISLQYLSIKGGVSYVSAGHYDDTFRRVDGRWRFASRRITFYFLGPLDQGWTGREFPDRRRLPEGRSLGAATPDFSDLNRRIEGREGPPLVLVHEMGGTLASWDPLVAVLGGTRRVVRHDMRGFGASPRLSGSVDLDRHVDDLLAVLDAERVEEPADLCGMALGAAVALRFAARHPDRVRSLGLMSPALGIAPDRRERMLARAERIEADGIAAIAEEELAITYPMPLRANGRFDTYRATWLGNDATSYAATYRTLTDIDAAADVATIARPTLVLAGTLDPLRPPVAMAEVADRIPGSRFVAIESGHVMAHQTPEAVAAALRTFWAEITGDEPASGLPRSSEIAS